MELSFTNLVASATLTPSSEAAGFDADNLRSPQRPFLVWRTTAVTEESVVIDFGAAATVGVAVLVNANFTSATLQGNASDAWGAPAFSQAVTLARGGLSRRWQHGRFLAGFNYRYLRVLIPAQTPVDGAAYFSLGGVWAGAIATMPRPYGWDEQWGVIEPHVDVGPASKAWRQRLVLGDPVATLAVRIASPVNANQPGVGDEWATWLDLERRITAADVFVLHPEQGDATKVSLWRRVDVPRWTARRLGLVETTWELEEPIGP